MVDSVSLKPLFKIGQKYKSPGKHPKVCEIIDIYTTTNVKGDVVDVRYVSKHLFCGQEVWNHDVCQTTVARGLLAP